MPPGQPFPVSTPLVLTVPTFRNRLCFSSWNASQAPFRARVTFMLGILVSLDRGGCILTTHPAPLLEDMAVSGGTRPWTGPSTSLGLSFSLAEWGS